MLSDVNSVLLIYMFDVMVVCFVLFSMMCRCRYVGLLLFFMFLCRLNMSML